ncbi:Hypothetical predicted protein [Mytilus galloprovincialis]|uniref:Endonuclease/exonuclease/phosphatase domain-containing protein n=1 Tax=Mytilus galloprovincialis TaxID=29158 RepID=A0A8B6E0Y8_MYTGA|nr:Hypothetical predicted protein [Mytilus galloprovincialis]
MTNIIQWNCRGLKINLLELTLLVQSFLPIAFCLQETHLKESDNVSLKGYNMFSTFSKVDERASGGSTIFVKDNVIHSTVQLTTDLQAVAIRLSLDKTITLCSIYIPPNSIIDKAKLKNLTDQLPSPFILMGDFNAHNPLWGSKTHNAKVLTSIADRTIPKTSANPKHPSKPWFDDACDQAIGDRKKSERRFNQQPTTENLSNFRIFHAKARRTCRQ